MKLSKTAVIVALCLLALALFLKIISNNKREPVVSTFPETIIVGTTSAEPYINLIAKTLAHKVLNMDTIQLMIVDMPPKMRSIYDAFVVPGPAPHSYVIFLSPTVRSQSEIRRVLSHEFAHIRQYNSKKLIPVNIDRGIYVWKGDTINFARISYEDREFEIEAFADEVNIKRELYNILYP